MFSSTRERRNQSEMLMDETDAVATKSARRERQGNVDAADRQLPAGIGRVKPGEDLDEGRFAGAVLTQEPVDFALGDLERRVVQGALPAERLGQSGQEERQRRSLDRGRVRSRARHLTSTARDR